MAEEDVIRIILDSLRVLADTQKTLNERLERLEKRNPVVWATSQHPLQRTWEPIEAERGD